MHLLGERERERERERGGGGGGGGRGWLPPLYPLQTPMAERLILSSQFHSALPLDPYRRLARTHPFL